MTGEEPFNFFMAIHFPESNLKIMDYNRVLRTLNGMSSEEFLAKVSESYIISEPLAESDNPRPTKKNECSLYLDSKWYKLQAMPEKIDQTNLTK